MHYANTSLWPAGRRQQVDAVGNRHFFVEVADRARPVEYPRATLLGDAPGDLKAAKANHACFYPINPGDEDQSWKRLHDEAAERFFAGAYRGQNLPRERFKAQAEGVALFACDDGSGYWLTTDQNSDLTVFHVFDRRELGYLGSFTGATTALTDGIWLQQAGTAAFPQGVLYAAHNDESVAAFDWRDIAGALDIRARCD